jgi:hypothetical protein
LFLKNLVRLAVPFFTERDLLLNGQPWPWQITFTLAPAGNPLSARFLTSVILPLSLNESNSLAFDTPGVGPAPTTPEPAPPPEPVPPPEPGAARCVTEK